MHTGGKWSGDYLVVDAAMYAKRPMEFAAHMRRFKEIVVGSEVSFPVRDGKLTALPTDQQEGRCVLGETQRDESLDKTQWDWHPDIEPGASCEAGGVLNRGGPSDSSVGGAGSDAGAPNQGGRTEQDPDVDDY